MFWKMLLKKDRNSRLHFHPEGKQEVSLKDLGQKKYPKRQDVFQHLYRLLSLGPGEL